MLDRQGTNNAGLSPKLLRKHARVVTDGVKLLDQATEELGLSARAYDRIIKVARTIADLDEREDVNVDDISEAIGYRVLDRATV